MTVSGLQLASCRLKSFLSLLLIISLFVRYSFVIHVQIILLLSLPLPLSLMKVYYFSLSFRWQLNHGSAQTAGAVTNLRSLATTVH